MVRVDEACVYLDRYWGEEQQVVADLRARTTAAPPDVPAAVLDAALAAYFPDDAYADQRAAAAKAARHWTSVITGGPGTGKTSTVARLLGVLLRAHAASDDAGRPLRVALAAPTGKAAARMVQAVRESTGQRGFPREDDATGRRSAPSPGCRPPRCTGCWGGRRTAPASGTTAATGCPTTWSWSTRPRCCR